MHSRFGVGSIPGSAASIRDPSYTAYKDGPQLQTGFGDAGKLTSTYGTDFSADRQKVEDAMFARANPQIERDRAALETSLVNQGIRRGSDAWATAMAEQNRSVNDQRTSIILGAGQEQSRLAGLERDRASFENSAQQQNFDQMAARLGISNEALQQMFQNQNTTTSGNNALEDQRTNAALSRFNAQNTERNQVLTERFAERNQPLNEIAGLLNGAQVTNPTFANTNMPSIPTVDYAGLVQQDYSNKLGAYGQQVAQRNSILGGLFGLGANAIMASDRRLKRDVRRIGTYRNGLGRYSYRYQWSNRRHIGVMSDEVRKVRPEAVVVINGFDAVDYRRALA